MLRQEDRENKQQVPGLLVPKSEGEAYSLYGVREGYMAGGKELIAECFAYSFRWCSVQGECSILCFAPNTVLLQAPPRKEVGFFDLCIFWVPNLQQLHMHTGILVPWDFFCICYCSGGVGPGASTENKVSQVQPDSLLRCELELEFPIYLV